MWIRDTGFLQALAKIRKAQRAIIQPIGTVRRDVQAQLQRLGDNDIRRWLWQR